jgi:hypothetical protein
MSSRNRGGANKNGDLQAAVSTTSRAQAIVSVFRHSKVAPAENMIAFLETQWFLTN